MDKKRLLGVIHARILPDKTGATLVLRALNVQGAQKIALLVCQRILKV
jgi:hypothetical protein